MFAVSHSATRSATRSTSILSRRSINSSIPILSGHNRWSKIGRDKGIADVKKSLIYSKAALEIVNSAKLGGSPDPSINLQLAIAIKKAKANGVPKDNINAALARAADPSKQNSSQSVIYEALGPGNTGMIVECQSDNVNRTFKNIRKILTDNGAQVASVAFMFKKVGRITLTPREDADAQDVWDAAIEAGAEDVESNPDESTKEMEVITSPSTLNAVSSFLSKPPHSHIISSIELVYIPTSESDGSVDDATKEKLDKIVDLLEDDADCVKVWTT